MPVGQAAKNLGVGVQNYVVLRGEPKTLGERGNGTKNDDEVEA